MDMLKHIYKGIFGVLLIGFAACSTEQLEEDNGLTPGTTPIQMMGAVTRAGDTNGNLDGYAGLYLSAKIDPATDYFTNNAITVASSEATKSVLDVHMYYPLDKDKIISLYGHSGEVTDGNISLTSGTAATNDALISNGTDGSGTAGSVNSPVSMLTFRHVMTKVTVKVVIDDNDMQEAKPTNIQIGFDDSKVAGSGKYALTATTDANATDISGSYTLEGSADGIDNYLVPTGETLSEAAGFIKSLKIDDYTATAADLTNLIIPQADLGGTLSDLILKPGLAYTLTFKIKRLKVVGIALTMKEWDIKTGDGEWGYDPYKVKMNVTGGYSNSDDKLISKIVLHYTPSSGQSETYQYIGTGVADGKDSYAHFVTLPKTDKMTDGTLKADLYTRNGLLIVGHEVKFKEVDTSFDINLGSNGMVVKDGYHQVTTPLQFYNMMSNPEAGTKYRLTENIDINSLPLAITPTAFPAGAELDGNGKSILHLKLKGTGLFTTNNGTLKNIHSSFCSIDATESGDIYVGGLCSINNGTIEGCINEADIKTSELQIAGGICGKNDTNGTVLACLNTGNIPAGDKIGGICGENANPAAGAITACISAGMLHGSSNHHVDSDIGGICGYQSIAKTSDAVINACFWLTGTSRPAQGSSDEKAIGSFGSGITPSGDYCLNTTNMTETLLRTEAVAKLNNALTGKDWKFEWDKNLDGTYKTVWPMPVKNITP